MNTKLEKIKEEISIAEERARQKRERDMNKGRKEHSFRIGDLVWLHTMQRSAEGMSKKLKKPWKGPYRIIELPTSNNVKLQDLAGQTLDGFIHVSRLKKFETPRRPEGEEGSEPLKPMEIEETSKEEFEVKRIMGERYNRGRKEYLVQWKGYPPDEATWEPRNNMTHAKAIVERYEKEKALKCDECGFIANNRRGLRNHKENDHKR
jgi:hypothetical protein